MHLISHKSIPQVLLLMKMLWRLLVLFSLCLVTPSDAHSFLLVPMPGGSSHCLEFMGIGRALQERGHTVHLLVPDFYEVNKCVPRDLRGEIQILTYRTDPEVAELIQSNLTTFTASMASGEGSIWNVTRGLRMMIPQLCRMHTEAKPVLQRFISTSKDTREALDMVIIDGTPFCRCLMLIPAYLRAPFAMTGSFISPFDSSMPWPITSYPIPLSDLPGKMTFGQRLHNTLLFGFIQGVEWMFDYMYDQGDDFGEDLAHFDFGGAMREAVLYLENSDYLVDYAKATYPNFIQVGGLTTGPAKPMPNELQKYFNASKDGVVIVSFGSMLFNASQTMTDKLLSATGKVSVMK